MQRETIKDNRGCPIGFLDYEPGGDIVVRDAAGRYLGRYQKLSDYTVDSSGRFLYKGNCAMMLLR